MMELRQLRYFAEIARKGSFTKGAEALGLTQPALSRQIERLERELGSELFLRGSREVSLTAAGELLLTRSTALLDLYAEIVSSASPTPWSGECTISTGGTVATYLLPGLLKKLRTQFPSLWFRVIEGDAIETRDALLHGEADVGILTGPVDETALARLPLITDRIVPIVAANDPLTKQKRVSIDEIRERDFILFHPESAIRRKINGAFRKLSPPFHPRIAMELRGVESVLQCVKGGLGIAFVSTFALQRGVKVLELPELSVEREFYLCYRPSQRGQLLTLFETIVSVLKTGSK